MKREKMLSSGSEVNNVDSVPYALKILTLHTAFFLSTGLKSKDIAQLRMLNINHRPLFFLYQKPATELMREKDYRNLLPMEGAKECRIS